MAQIYLDYAAATAMDLRVLSAMQPYFTDNFYNPSAGYLAAKAVNNSLGMARGEIAKVLGVRPAEVVFTAGGTEANNLAIDGVVRQFPDAHVVVSAIEHDSVLVPAQAYAYSEALVGPDGIIAVDKLKETITDQTVLVSVMYANNEIGTIQPLVKIAQIINEIRLERMHNGNTRPLYFHTDACQAANYLHVYANTLGVDMMTINSGKIYGPKQCGALFVKSTVKVHPQIRGGGQERGMRSGTENMAGIVGFAKALQITTDIREAETKRIAVLQQLFIEQLSQKLPQSKLNGSLANRLVNNVHITIPGTDNERIIYELDERGIQCAAGSACSASKSETSHTLRAIGLSDKDAQSSLRFTMGRQTSRVAVLRAVDTLVKLVA